MGLKFIWIPMLKGKDLLYIFLLAFLWSFTFLLVRMCVFHVVPVSLTFYRLVFASIAMILLSLITRSNPFLHLKYWPHLLVSSFLLNALPFTLCSIGEVWIDSSTTGIIEGSTPLFTLFFTYLFLKNRKIYARQIIGFILGFSGLLVVFIPTLYLTGRDANLGPLLALISMAISFAAGFLYVERFLKAVPPISAVTIQIFFSPFLVFPFIYLIEGSLHHLPTHVMVLLSILGLSSSLGWVVYFFGVKHTSAANLSLAAMLCPILTIIWGNLFLGEPVTWYKVLGIVIVILSLFSMGTFLPHTIKK